MKLIVEPPAREELDQAAFWYEQQSTGLGDDFADAIGEAIERIQADPLCGSLMETCEDPQIRRVPIRRFPYIVIYDCHRLPDELRVLAIMHMSRRPNYWKGR